MDITNKIKRCLDLAKKQALKSTFRERHGAILVKGGQILNCHHNDSSSSSFAMRFPRYLDGKQLLEGSRHAEVQVILGIDKTQTKHSTVFLVRIGRDGNFIYSKPCPMCQKILKYVGVKKCIYSISKEEIGVIRF
jgi:tRNA(Arg) A34 adenosine deaminase TadA